MALWEADIIPVITNSDFGFLGNLIPIALILGISWALSKKLRDILYIQLPVTLGIRLIFPFLNVSFVLLSFALFIMNMIGSKGDLLADIKETPKKIRDRLMHTPDMYKQAKEEIRRNNLGERFAEVREKMRR